MKKVEKNSHIYHKDIKNIHANKESKNLVNSDSLSSKYSPNIGDPDTPEQPGPLVVGGYSGHI